MFFPKRIMISLYFDNFNWGEGGGGQAPSLPTPLKSATDNNQRYHCVTCKTCAKEWEETIGIALQKTISDKFIFRFRFIVEECGCRKGQGYKLNKPLVKFCICNMFLKYRT